MADEARRPDPRAPGVTDDTAGLPAPYVDPWLLLRRDLGAVLASSRLRLRELWRLNLEGSLALPGFWPEALAAWFWPLLLALAILLVTAVIPNTAQWVIARVPGPSPDPAPSPAERTIAEVVTVLPVGDQISPAAPEPPVPPIPQVAAPDPPPDPAQDPPADPLLLLLEPHQTLSHPLHGKNNCQSNANMHFDLKILRIPQIQLPEDR